MNDKFAITLAEGYKSSTTNTADGTWENSLSYTAETAIGNVEFVDITGWEDFLSTITLGLFYKDEATDSLSGVASVECYAADKAMTLDEVKGITNWTA